MLKVNFVELALPPIQDIASLVVNITIFLIGMTTLLSTIVVLLCMRLLEKLKHDPS